MSDENKQPEVGIDLMEVISSRLDAVGAAYEVVG